MRIIEPASKLRTLELLERYFGLSYARRTLYRLLPQLIDRKNDIEEAAYRTAWRSIWGVSSRSIWRDWVDWIRHYEVPFLFL